MKSFSEQLNYYINLIDVRSNDLSVASGISESTISRYRNGNRTPKSDNNIHRLAASLATFAQNSGLELTEDEIFSNLSPKKSSNLSTDSLISNRLDILLRRLDVNIKDLAAYISYDASYISKIRNGKRTPAHPDNFAHSIADYIISNKDFDSALLDEITSQELSQNPVTLQIEYLKNWLLGQDNKTSSLVRDFLSQLDSFDLNEYIKVINFDDIKVPTAPFTLPTSKRYYGLEGMKNAEIDYLKTAVTSKHTQNIYLASDIPLTELAKDSDFSKKWMYGLAVAIKKGIHLHVIHDIDRPFDEMMIGLLGWIPLYMTGQISPYYLSEKTNTVYGHLHRYCESVAMTGECIISGYSDLMCYITANRRELEFYEKKITHLFDAALPLMQIYNRENAKSFKKLRKKLSTDNTPHTTMCSAPPLYSMPSDLLKSMLERNRVPYETQNKLLAHAQREQKHFLEKIKNSKSCDILPDINENDFKHYDMQVYFADIFYNRPILYTYEEYRRHLETTVALSQEHPNYTVKYYVHPVFSNIQICVVDNSMAIISKIHSPNIHFVIRHPKMLNAIEHFIRA